jgi:hypothetical protein
MLLGGGFGDVPNRSKGFINYQKAYRQTVYLPHFSHGRDKPNLMHRR